MDGYLSTPPRRWDSDDLVSLTCPGRKGPSPPADQTAVVATARVGFRIGGGIGVVEVHVGQEALREGAKVVLFLYGVAVSGGEAPAAVLLGGLGGIVLGGMLSWLIYRGLLIIPTGRLFAVTNVLLSLLAAGMAGQAAVYLVKAGLLPALGDQMWDTSSLLPDNGLVGRALHALIGYSDRPMGVQIAAYVGVLTILLALQRMLAPAAANRLTS